MSPHVTLTGVTPDDLLFWLSECIACAKQEMALHPLRPQPSAMIPCRVPLQQLRLHDLKLAGWCVGVYEVPPSEQQPFGTPLLLLGGALSDASPTESGELHIDIWCGAQFPLYLHEVALLLEERFSCKPALASPLAEWVPPCDIVWLPVTMGQPARLKEAGEVRTDRIAAQLPAQPAAVPSQADGACDYQHRSGMLPSTEWLAEQIAVLPESVNPELLYQGWMDHYRAHEGLSPRDSARSFGRALDTVFKHVGRTHRRRC